MLFYTFSKISTYPLVEGWPGRPAVTQRSEGSSWPTPRAWRAVCQLPDRYLLLGRWAAGRHTQADTHLDVRNLGNEWRKKMTYFCFMVLSVSFKLQPSELKNKDNMKKPKKLHFPDWPLEARSRSKSVPIDTPTKLSNFIAEINMLIAWCKN